ncbi:plasmid pRiA4b ORF-3 family protein [Isachenkonia alkalipeptolytica]|uniref:Plasmid pRiA4b ORF-3 family protein n=1 Tax=Isachenkonia alkalipeptolytica TaxID=2565777 RepID=A0AA43XIL6_9CLOT|nr:plasmid pRiA4b ORF-3 family protein [Isachenkonia alkalipeptolytica]
MYIQCTQKLREKMGLMERDLISGKDYQQYPSSLRAWHGNLIEYNEKQSVVLINDETRYGVLLFGMKDKEFKKIDGLILEGIRVALEMEGVRPEVIEEYLQEEKGIFYGKTKNRSTVAKLNSTTRNLHMSHRALEEDRIIQRNLSRLESRYPVEHGGYPYALMLLNLHAFDPYRKKSVVETPLYQLKIQLDLKGHEVYRRVAVPGLFTFRQLHRIIMMVFDWHETHLHFFEIEKENGESIRILMDDDPETLECFNEEAHQIMMDKTTLLQDVFPRHNLVKYTYDLGDHWVHKIELEQITMANQLEGEYLGGMGDRPPEDVGGESGFKEYLEVIRDEEHSDHERMKIWGESQKEKPRDSQRINQRIRWIF